MGPSRWELQGNITFVMEGNSFERIWCPAAFATVGPPWEGLHLRG
jgi:hypothetical protein